MSRIGKKPIPIPKGVEVVSTGGTLTVKGPRGMLKRNLHPKVTVRVQDGVATVSVPDESKESKSLHGLFRVLLHNMVKGVSEGFERILEIVGVGYRAEVSGKTATLNLGYSHPIVFELPDGVDMKVDRTRIVLSGIDKELVGQTAAKIRALRPPEPYKGKGIKYADEYIRRKAGKAGVK